MDYNILDDFYNGNCFFAYNVMGAHLTNEDGIDGVRFTVCAPKAQHIQIIGEFNNWDGAHSEMEKIDERGTYSLFIPDVLQNMKYKYRVFQCTGRIVDKSVPYAFKSELRPQTASIVADIKKNKFTDEKWMKTRTKNIDKPLNIYEMHFGSWKLKDIETEDIVKKWYNYREKCNDLIMYLKENNFTHIELLPLGEYPFDGSWGYQVSGYFSLTTRYGEIEDLVFFINECHNAGIGVILDFVPVHFVLDDYSLARFDGEPFYEYEFTELEHSQWGTCNFNLLKNEVKSFLMSAASYWLETFHIDGLRMDAIANALYWQGNSDRGVNVGGIDLLKNMNDGLNDLYSGIMLIAEDSSTFPKVTYPTDEGGLGFDYKWDMG